MGNRTENAADSPAPRRPVETGAGELRLVTVFVADIVDSTALIADLEPEEAAEALRPTLRTMRSTIERFSGTVIRVAGDGMLAVFGAPIAYEDHATRACHAARELNAAKVSTQIGSAGGRSLQFRIGLHSGDVFFNRSIDLAGRSVPDIEGATVHLAARIQASAAPGSIRLTRATAFLIDRVFTTIRLGEIAVKGFVESVETFVLDEPRVPAYGGITRANAGAFIGRDAEMQALAEAATLARAGKGCAVAIVGEPGIGKSRLASEFLASPGVDGFSVTRAGAASIGEANANQVLFDLIALLFDIPPGLTADTLLDRMAVGALAGAPAQAAARLWRMLRDDPVVLPHWQALSPEDRRYHRAQAFHDLLRAITPITPLIIVVEDLHWADEETRALLDVMVQRMSALRAMLVVTYRPDYVDRWAVYRQARCLRLDPFSDADARRLVANQLGDDVGLPDLVTRLAATTGGNPLFIAESVHALADGGFLEGEPGAFHLRKEITRIDVPTSVHSIIAARLDRRDDEERRLLQAAATLGVQFPLNLLVRILDENETRIVKLLKGLADASIVHQVRVDPEPEYAFAHALIRDEAYRHMLKSQRRVLHAAAFAAVLTSGQEGVERLAYHSAEAGLHHETAEWNRRAAARARLRAANEEAIQYLETAVRAIGQWSAGRETEIAAIDARLEMRVSYYAAGRIEELLEHATVARGLAQAIGDVRRTALATTMQTLCHWRRGGFDVALATALEAEALAVTVGDRELAVLAHFGLGQVRHALGEYQASVGPLRAALALAGPAPDRNDFIVSRHAVHARAILAVSLAEIGATIDAATVAAEGLHIALDLGDGFAEGFARFAAGYVSLRANQLEAAWSVLRPGLESSLAGRVGGFMAFLAATSGVVLVRLGRADEGLALVDRACSALARHRPSHFQLPFVLQSEAYLAAGRAPDARRAAEECVEMCRGRGERGYECWSLTIAAESSLADGDPQAAAMHCGAALGLADATGQQPARDRCITLNIKLSSFAAGR